MGTNTLVICVAPLGITSIAIEVALRSVVRCKNRFAEGTLNEGLIEDETESAEVRVRGQFVGDGRVAACQVVRGDGLVCRVPACGSACNRILILVRWIRNVESYLIEVVGRYCVGVAWFIGGDLEQKLLSNGSVEARDAVIFLEQWVGGSTYA
jgi:hypothetical protein